MERQGSRSQVTVAGSLVTGSRVTGSQGHGSRVTGHGHRSQGHRDTGHGSQGQGVQGHRSRGHRVTGHGLFVTVRDVVDDSAGRVSHMSVCWSVGFCLSRSGPRHKQQRASVDRSRYNQQHLVHGRRSDGSSRTTSLSVAAADRIASRTVHMAAGAPGLITPPHRAATVSDAPLHVPRLIQPPPRGLLAATPL